LGAERTYVGVNLAATPALLSRQMGPGDAQGAGWRARMVDLPDPGWRLLAAAPTAPVMAVAVAWAIGAATVALVLAGMVKAWDQRRQIIALRLSQSEKLEAMVSARTSDLAREVEARKQAEADLRAAQEHLIHSEKMAALGRMSTAIVHEISQPLAAMEATLTAAEMTLPAHEQTVAPRLATAKGLIRRMQRTTKHLKSFGRKEAGTLSLIDLRPVVTSAIELVTPRARTVGVTPVFAGGQAQVMAGAVRMEQVLVNLLINALDAVEGRVGASVTVTLEMVVGQAVLRVSDTGPGIAPDDLPRVVEPFFSTKISGEGLGLGLSISRAILAEFGGDLSVASTLGQGTCVTVTLPLASARLEAAQ
jgi:two-component system C4-dicarboxylate transport sensor histidine kinase DctB